MTALIETTPKMDLAIHDIEHLVEELRAYHAIYSPLFQRREQREAAHTYLQGLLAPLPRKSIEPMVLAVEGVAPKAVRAMQSFIREGMWHDEQLWHQHWQEVETALGADDGVLMVDGSDFPKQGVHSVGVKRQYCGELGKRANCQAGVCVGYVSPQGYTLLDRRLYLPVEWLTDDTYAERRRQCGIPAEMTFKTKPELAQEMLAAVVTDAAPAVSLGGGRRGVWGQPELSGGGSGVGPVVFCRSAPHHAGVGRAPGHAHPAVAGARASPAAGAPGGGGTRGADGAGGGCGAACRGVDTPDDQGREPGAHGGGVCRQAGGGRAGRLAGS